MKTPKVVATFVCTALLASAASGQSSPTLQVTVPTVGQTLTAGTTVTVTWNATHPVGYVDIQLVKGQQAYASVGYVPMAAGQFDWDICPALGDGADYSLLLTGDVAAVSAASATFTVAGSVARPTLAITYPLGGESITAGGSVNPMLLKWTSTNPAGQVYVDLLRDGQYVTTIAYLPMSVGQYSWSPCSNMPTSAGYSIRISADGCGDGIEASSNTFSITGTPLAAVAFTQPQGGEVWAAGTPHTITWAVNWSLQGTVKLDLLRDGQWYADLGNPTATSSRVTWTICPYIGDSANYTIRGTQIDTCGQPFTTISAPFTIVGSTPGHALSLLQPTAGEAWALGGSLPVKWQGTGAGSLVADLLLHGEPYARLGIPPISAGMLQWPIPTTLTPDSDWQVVLRATECGRVIAAQGENFTIASPNPTASIVHWRSVRTHRGIGPLSVELDPAAYDSATVESRGLRTIEVEFDGPIVLVDPAKVSIAGQPQTAFAPSSVSVDRGNVLVISCELPDQGCYRIVVGPGTISANLVGDTDCMVRTLLGDADGNGVVEQADVDAIRAKLSQPAVASPRLDVTTTMGINLIDMSLAKSRFGKYAVCP
jgi:hypothetical protein